jgi:hypothetical protein
MSSTVIKAMSRGWRSDEATIRSMIEGALGAESPGGKGVLIEFA